MKSFTRARRPSFIARSAQLASTSLRRRARQGSQRLHLSLVNRGRRKIRSGRLGGAPSMGHSARGWRPAGWDRLVALPTCMAVLTGVLVVAPAGSAAAATSSAAIGVRPHYKLQTQKLSDRLDVSVNLANGNLVVHALDLGLKGRAGHDFTIERYHNSLGGAVSSMRANGWTFGVIDAWLDTSFADGSVSYHDPSGYSVAFEKLNGLYEAPAGLDAILEQLSASRWQLTFYRTGEKYVFDQGGSPGKALLVEHLDRNSNKITVGHVNDSFGRRPSTITDSRGKTTTILWNADGTIDRIEDPQGIRNRYDLDDSRNLFYYGSGPEFGF